MAHFFLPNEKINKNKLIGLLIAFSGVSWAILIRGNHGSSGSLVGDLFALAGSIGWALIILMARGTNFSKFSPEMQLLWMVLVSGPLLILISPLFGDIIREFEYYHLLGLGFQSMVVVSGGFIFWLWLLSIYPASSVASFAFLSPIFGIACGWLFLDETLDSSIFGSAAMVVTGIFLINKTPLKQK
jgi:drug/metabolite transporter (DMT)-like permease